MNLIAVLEQAQEREGQLLALASQLAERAASPARIAPGELAEHVALFEDYARELLKLGEGIAAMRLHAADPANFQIKH